MATSLKDAQDLANSLQVSLDAEQQQVADLLAQKETLIAEKDTLIAEKDTLIAEKDTTIATLQAIIDSGGDPVALQTLVDTLTATKADLEGTVTE